MKFPRITLAIIAVLILSGLFLLGSTRNDVWRNSISNGDWHTNASIGSKDAGVMLRAAVSIGGLLASTRDDSIYYVLSSVDGEPLALSCDYRIVGGRYDADWWSITAYGWDFYLIPNSEKRYSFNNENVTRDEAGDWVISMSAARAKGDWLPIGPSGAQGADRDGKSEFDLLFRLYTPGDEYLSRPRAAPLPELSLVGCA